jgi:preprotein translocase subunit SecA
MLKTLVKKVLGSRNDRVIKQYSNIINTVNNLSDGIASLSDDELKAKTIEFKELLKNGKTLDDILPEVFAVVREAAKRAIGLYHHNVQIIGGLALHNGQIAEMGTGEGKTLVATLPAYLNALNEKGVHIVTVNDYLAQRDGAEMGKVYEFLGLKTGVITSNMDFADKQAAYNSDITYGTNNELGFDYLRDNMVFERSQKNQKELNFAIVDEVDSILIDEARTPLVISGPSDDHSASYATISKFIGSFTEQIEEGEGKEKVITKAGDYTKDEKHKQVLLTDEGHTKAEELLIKHNVLKIGESLYDPANIMLMQHLTASLRANFLFANDVDYIVENNEVIIIDEFTGRKMPGRRWGDGLHQAIEAKEGVSIKQENQTLASITFQNYFRMYNKLAGMTGTADTEAEELLDIYGLEVVVIPPNKPSQRNDNSDQIYMTKAEKYQAILADIKDCQARKQPVLVGTASIESSQIISDLLKKAKIKHNVLNAKQHEKEAGIIAGAGSPGAVTIATNMAGRGTDIVLGGKKTDENQDNWQGLHDEVLAAGGLHIIGTERNESRRVDNQLRGRSGRQGDVGSTRFYLSLEDNLMRIFASEKMANMMKMLGMKQGEVIEHKMINRAIENAQRKVEAMNYDMRKNLLEYDNIANEQRKVIYNWRDDLISTGDVYDRFVAMRADRLSSLVDDYLSPNTSEDNWDILGLEEFIKSEYLVEVPIAKWLDEGVETSEVLNRITEGFDKIYKYKEELATSEQMRGFEKAVMLQILDNNWKEHLASMDYLRSSINLRGYAQKNPVQEYKAESFNMFESLIENVNNDIVKTLSTVQVNQNTSSDDVKQQEVPQNTSTPAQNSAESGKKIGRNEPCPCGSGKKYKQCCGKK